MTLWHRIWGHPVSAFLSLVLLAWVAWTFKLVLILVFAALMLTLCLLPAADRLERIKIPRFLSVPFIMAGAVLLVLGILVYIIPPVLNQLMLLIRVLPQNLQQLHHLFGQHLVAQALQTASSYSQQAGQTAVALTTGFLRFLSLLAVVIFLSVYWLIDYRQIKRRLIGLLEPNHRPKARQLADNVEDHMISWLRGQILLSLIVGACVGVVYWLIGLPFALALAIIAALLEIVPFLGPLLAVIPAFLLALTISPTKALLVVIAYLFIQSVEGNVLVPKVMGRAVHLHPLVVIISFLIGEQIAGLVGIFLAIPAVLVLRDVYRVYAPEYLSDPAPEPAR